MFEVEGVFDVAAVALFMLIRRGIMLIRGLRPGRLRGREGMSASESELESESELDSESESESELGSGSLSLADAKLDSGRSSSVKPCLSPSGIGNGSQLFSRALT